MSDRPTPRHGALYAVAAYGSWGVVPLYWRFLSGLGAVEILAHRVAFSLVFVLGLLLATGRLGELGRTLASGRKLAVLALTSALISVNWGVFIHAVTSGQLVSASLGYFMNPLINVALGVLVLRESIRPLAKIGVALGALGLVVMVAGKSHDGLWIALVLAGSFAAYGFLRKRAPVDSVMGLAVETLLVAPLAFGYLALREIRGVGVIATGGPILLCVLAGPITALPLAWFASAARRLPLSRLGFFQYLAPSLQFAIAVAAFGETPGPAKLAAFGLVWAALALVACDEALALRAPKG